MSLPNLPQFQGGDREFQLMQSAWTGVLNPFLRQPVLNGLLLSDVALGVGNTVINHRLGRTPQGWALVDINGAAQIYRSAAFNSLTLTLNSDAAITVGLYIF